MTVIFAIITHNYNDWNSIIQNFNLSYVYLIFFLFSTRIRRYYILTLTLKIVKEKKEERSSTNIPRISVISHMIFISHISVRDKPQSVNTTLVRKTKCKRLPFEGVLRRGINAGATPSRNQLLYTAVTIVNFLWISSYTVIY